MATVDYRWNPVTDNILCEQDEDGTILATYTHEPSLYGELVSQERDSQTSYFHFDGQGSTRALTDEGENVTDTSTYSAFGEVVEKTSSTTNPFGYKGAVGYYTNGDTDDIYVRARTYEPKIARWLTLDPIGFVDGVNRYAFVRNNPLWFQDSSGLACAPPTKVGANYVGGRGAFDGPPQWGNPMTTGTINIPGWIEPMYLLAEWVPDPTKFGSADCCCCDEIGWVQIIKDVLLRVPGNRAVRGFLSVRATFARYLQNRKERDRGEEIEFNGEPTSGGGFGFGASGGTGSPVSTALGNQRSNALSLAG